MEEENVLMSDDLQGSVDPASLVEGVARTTSLTTSHQSPPLIGYPPLTDQDKSLYFYATLTLSDEFQFTGTVTRVMHGSDFLELRMDIGNDDYFRLAGLGPKTVCFLEVKLTNPLGDQVVLLENVSPHYVKAEPKLHHVAMEFEFPVKAVE